MKRKTLLILFGVLASLILLELGLRVAGFTYIYLQNEGNKRSLNKKGAYKILCLGESTTADQYPKYLEQELNSRGLGISFSVIDKGRPCVNTNYILANLNNNLDMYKPDMVITMMGVNDYRSDVVVSVYEHEQTLSFYKKLKTYKLMRLTALHLNSRFGEIKSSLKKAGESIRELAEDKRMEIKAIGIGKGALTKVVGYVEKGHYYRDAGRHKKAEHMYKKALSVDPVNEPALLGLADNYGSMGMYDDVDRICTNLIATNPKDELAYLHLAHWHIKQRRYKETEFLLRKAIEINPKNSWAYVKLGNSCMEQKKYKEAQELYKKVIDLHPNDGQGYLNLGDYYKKIGRYKEAQNLYEKAVELSPNDVHGYEQLGYLYGEQKRYKEAESFLRKAIKINPNDSWEYYIMLGNWYVEQKRYQEAEKLYRKVIGLKPESLEVYIKLGCCYMQQQRYTEAEEILYRKVIKLEPNPIMAFRLFSLSKVYESQNRYDEAAMMLKKEMKLENEIDIKSKESLRFVNVKDTEIRYKKIKEETLSLYFCPGTVYNYKALRKILEERKIPYLSVQYPMRKVTDLKGIFEGDKGIIFVDNEKTFKDGVKKEGYDAYFVDKITEEFGHCTPKGNKLLAGNITDTITKEVFHR